MARAGFIELRIWTMAGCCKDDIVTSGFLKGGKYFDYWIIRFLRRSLMIGDL
jgi:hypothetical protein